MQMCGASRSLGVLQICTSWEYRLAFLPEHMLMLAQNLSPDCELHAHKDEQLLMNS